MKKFFLKLALFLLPIIGCAYFLDVFISQKIEKSNRFAIGEISVWNDIMNGKLDSDILIYGSSRAWVHFNATKIGDSLQMPTYNLGIDGHNFWLQYLRHELMSENNRLPKIIIQSLDDHTLVKRSDLYNSEQFLPYLLKNKKIREATAGYEGFNFYDSHFPLVRYYGKIDVFKEVKFLIKNPEQNLPVRIKGYKGHVQTWNEKNFEKAKASINLTITTDPASVILFENYIRECQSKNIKLILVYPPAYIEGQKLVKNRDQIISIYKDLSEKYKLHFYDFSNDDLSKDKKYFYNAMHLNKTGAELFTDRLIDSLKSNSDIRKALEKK